MNSLNGTKSELIVYSRDNMSVESCCFIVDWAMLQRMPKDADLVDHFIMGPQSDDDDDDDDERIEDNADDDDDDDDGWLAEGSRRFDFGNHDYYFESWNFFTLVSDWLRPLREELDKSIERPFTTLFMAIGVLFDDNYGPAGIKQGVEFADASLIAAISPAEVEKLRSARTLDRSTLEREFDRVLADHPCPGLPNGKAVREWVDALDNALSGVSETEGILILAPV